MGTLLLCLSNELNGEIMLRRYDAAFPDGPTHQGSYAPGTRVTQEQVDRFRLDPPDICAVSYEAEPLTAA